jgi:predicted N-acetyltransferase YhbS
VAEVRAVSPRDSAAVREVNQAVLGRPDEAALLNVLRDVRASFVSMVAAEGGTVVGHILFGRVSVEPEPPNEFCAVGLGPRRCSPPANGEAQARTRWKTRSKNAGAAATMRPPSAP